MIKTPSYLKKDDCIGIVCPAGFMPFEKVETCIRTLQEWGYQVRVGKTVGGSSATYFSGTDEERLNDLQSMLDDTSVDAVLFARGGYGMSRIIDRINFKKFRKQPKWLVGYSDITVLHCHLYARYGISSLHAPMAAAFNEEGFKNEYVLSLKNALEGKELSYKIPVHEFNRKGKGEGRLVGGNLALLAHLEGSPSAVRTKGNLLFIEDIGEYLYNIDRMLLQLKRAGKLEGLAGLIVGGFTDTKDTERPFGQDVYTIIREHVKEYDYPVCFDFPVSHSDRNYALKFGAKFKFKVGKNIVVLEE
jgi:muramoyltetrapeptide carboxypeptidase